MSVLDEILVTKRAEVARLAERAAAVEAEAAAAPRSDRDFAAALRRADGRLAVIAEIKRKSPSKGPLAPGLDAPATAARYTAGGAAALSVLTDGPWFDGSLDDLRAAREAVSVPVLRKDFTIDPLQLYEARAAGADAILLIVAALPDDALLADLGALAAELGLAALVEADDEAGVERALGAGARIVGVTNRNLRDFQEDLSTGARLAGLIPADVVAVAESAIRSVDDARAMADAGFSAVLVGEHLVRSPDPEAAVAALAAVRYMDMDMEMEGDRCAT
ncbi:MAG TPA: indole-3-glycerol phosphate synthase TrpC [Acidimicrobiia bacterium]|nr:indole-3-glycerol phosphate synthase TrpC [Acidimicrobiia bacterium]